MWVRRLAINGVAVRDAELEIVGRDDLLGEIAADIETADVAPQGQVLPRRKQLAKPRADEGVDPIDGA